MRERLSHLNLGSHSEGRAYSFEDDSEHGLYESDNESEGCRDLTACDSECGYCGRCPY